MGSIIIRKQILWNPYRWAKIFPEWVEDMDPEKDRLLLTWMANHALEPGKDVALRKLGVTEAPPFPWIRHPDCDLEEQYWVLKEQIEREDDREAIMKAAMDGPTLLAHFARNRITGEQDPAPEEDKWSFMTCECSQLPGVTPEYAAEFRKKWEQHLLRSFQPPGYRLFEPAVRNTWTAENVHMLFSGADLVKLYPSYDRLLLGNLARHSDRFLRQAVLRRLELNEPPVSEFKPEEERYRILMEQVCRIQSPEYLEEAAFGGRDDAGRAAFCRLTGYVFKEGGAHTFACPQTKEATPDMLHAFCGKMIKESGPFAGEAAEWLKAQASAVPLSDP